MNANETRLRDWIEKADHDLGTAIVINQYILEYSDTLAFHCQQATEKYIKCLLEMHSIPFKRSHDLRYLLDLLDEVIPIDKELYESLMKLNAFGVEIRYPDIKIELPMKDREESIQIAKDFREFLKLHIGFDIE
ncbi:MAG: HEPN domain-containing protein [Bacteroidota bacterium]|nr:HEPN domain-containing protein [Bacteroidota bacterium]